MYKQLLLPLDGFTQRVLQPTQPPVLVLRD